MAIDKPIRISDEIRLLLKKKKKYKRETYSDVIRRYMKKEVTLT